MSPILFVPAISRCDTCFLSLSLHNSFYLDQVEKEGAMVTLGVLTLSLVYLFPLQTGKFSESGIENPISPISGSGIRIYTGFTFFRCVIYPHLHRVYSLSRHNCPLVGVKFCYAKEIEHLSMPHRRYSILTMQLPQE